MTDKIKQRIEQINRREIPDGYKKTDVGIVPEDWGEVTLADVCTDRGVYGLNAPACDYSESLPVYLRITDIDDNGNFSKNNIVSVNDKNSDDYYLKENDIVFVRTGATTGKSYLYNKKDGKLVYAGFLIKFSVDGSKANAHFIKKLCDTSEYWNWVKTVSARSGQPGINADEYSKFKFTLPTDKKEQQKISEILSKWDKSVSLQEKLIEKIEVQKEALIQNLLSPKEEWSKFKIGMLVEEKTKRNTGNSTNVKSVSNKYGFINQEEQFTKQVASQDTSNYKVVSYGDIAYNPSRINVGSIALYQDNEEGIVSPMYVVFKCKKISPKLLLLMLTLNRTKYDIKSKLLGSVRDSLSFSDLSEIEIYLPDKQYEEYVLGLFDNFDNNLDLQKKKLETMKQQQKAMQQLLLTGIVRV